MHAHEALERVKQRKSVERLLDLGSGNGVHAKHFRDAGLDVITVDHTHNADFQLTFDNFFKEYSGEKFDCVWISHVLEHVLDVQAFLVSCKNLLNPRGIIAVTVPPLKHQIVGGHVNLFNEGLLCYRLILAGFDCSMARVGVYGYNISVLAEVGIFDMPDLYYDCGDIEKLADWFPVPVEQGFNGQIGNIRW